VESHRVEVANANVSFPFKKISSHYRKASLAILIQRLQKPFGDDVLLAVRSLEAENAEFQGANPLVDRWPFTGERVIGIRIGPGIMGGVEFTRKDRPFQTFGFQLSRHWGLKG